MKPSAAKSINTVRALPTLGSPAPTHQTSPDRTRSVTSLFGNSGVLTAWVAFYAVNDQPPGNSRAMFAFGLSSNHSQWALSPVTEITVMGSIILMFHKVTGLKFV